MDPNTFPQSHLCSNFHVWSQTCAFCYLQTNKRTNPIMTHKTDDGYVCLYAGEPVAGQCFSAD